MAKDVTVASAPNAGVTDPNMKGAKTPATAASPSPIPNAAAETRSTSMPVANASSRRDITARVKVPGRVRLAAEQLDLDGREHRAECTARNRALAGAEKDGRDRFQHLRQTEEQDD